jgi:serine/threonine protein phosphatase PrpC
MEYNTAHLSVAANSANQDRVVDEQRGATRLLIIADGAGGRADGGQAAELAVNSITGSRMPPTLTRQPDYWASTLSMVDGYIYREFTTGECAIVVAAIVDDVVVGASVGDSGAWLFACENDHHLTAAQRRKPFLGSGNATCIPFGPVRFDGTLILASDGLFKYAAIDAIRDAATGRDASNVADSLIDLVRLPSGDLNDDTTVIVCRRSQTAPAVFTKENSR